LFYNPHFRDRNSKERCKTWFSSCRGKCKLNLLKAPLFFCHFFVIFCRYWIREHPECSKCIVLYRFSDSVTSPYLGLMNNALIERTQFKKKVWLSALTPAPYLTDVTETLAIMEQANIAMWVALGFEVRIIHANFHPFWQWLGGLRCLTNHF
jgi:hypothetical protein